MATLQEGAAAYKFPYQKAEREFLDNYYSPYLDIRSRTQDGRTSFVSAYFRDCSVRPMQRDKDIAAIIATYLGFNFHVLDNDIYRLEVEKIMTLFKKFKTDYMDSQPPKPPKAPKAPKIKTKSSAGPPPHRMMATKAKKVTKKRNFFDDSMTEWEAKYEENPLTVDGVHVFNIPEPDEGYFDYECNENMNLCPEGAVMIIAPNKLEYIVPGDRIFCYLLHGGYRKRRPRNRWYFWTDIDAFNGVQQVYERYDMSVPQRDDV